jgi:Tn3 transposase DDE domain/TrwC relaxase
VISPLSSEEPRALCRLPAARPSTCSGLCHLLGFRFAPRLRDLSERRLYYRRSARDYRALDCLIGGAINLRKNEANWDEILQMTASIRAGPVAPSVLMRRLAAYPRQNALEPNGNESPQRISARQSPYPNMVFAKFVHGETRPVDGIPDPHRHIHVFAMNATFDEVENEWYADGDHAGMISAGVVFKTQRNSSCRFSHARRLDARQLARDKYRVLEPIRAMEESWQ